jgi:hypothetical protein
MCIQRVQLRAQQLASRRPSRRPSDQPTALFHRFERMRIVRIQFQRALQENVRSLQHIDVDAHLARFATLQRSRHQFWAQIRQDRRRSRRFTSLHQRRGTMNESRLSLDFKRGCIARRTIARLPATAMFETQSTSARTHRRTA